MQTQPRKPKGSITLIAVFLTALIAFLLAFGDHVGALQENAIAQSDAATERAFFAAQTCVEEGFLGLRTDAGYASPYTAAFPLLVGNATCILEVIPDAPGATSGTLRGIGMARDTVRTVSATYRDAGPWSSRNDTAIFHIIDKSTSMRADGFGCTLTEYPTQTECIAHGGVWGQQPFASVKEAAKNFLNRLDTAHDQIGVVSFNANAQRHPIPPPSGPFLTNDFTAARTVINDIAISTPGTNIGDGVRYATEVLLPVTGRTRIEILLTDGQPNNPPGVDPRQYARDQATVAKDAGIILFTIGLGNSTDENLLRSMASVIDGETLYYRAPTAQDLDAIYARIADILIAFRIAQGSWDEE